MIYSIKKEHFLIAELSREQTANIRFTERLFVWQLEWHFYDWSLPIAPINVLHNVEHCESILRRKKKLKRHSVQLYLFVSIAFKQEKNCKNNL